MTRMESSISYLKGIVHGMHWAVSLVAGAGAGLAYAIRTAVKVEGFAKYMGGMVHGVRWAIGLIGALGLALVYVICMWTREDRRG